MAERKMVRVGVERAGPAAQNATGSHERRAGSEQPTAEGIPDPQVAFLRVVVVAKASLSHRLPPGPGSSLGGPA